MVPRRTALLVCLLTSGLCVFLVIVAPTISLLRHSLTARPLTWTLFTGDSVFSSLSEVPLASLTSIPGLKKDLTAVIGVALSALNRRQDSRTPGMQYTVADFSDGMFAMVPGERMRYRLAFRSLARVGELETVEVERVLSPPTTAAVSTVKATEPIFLIVPYLFRPETLRRFLMMLTPLARRHNLHMALMFFWHGQENEQVDDLAVGSDYVTAQKALEELNAAVGRQVARLIALPGAFSRGRALLAGAESWSGGGDVLLFLVDVDMAFGDTFLRRCRLHAAPGRRAYFPIVFSEHNPRLLAAAQNRSYSAAAAGAGFPSSSISALSGFWVDFGYGMSCTYLSDFRALTDQRLDVTGWGGEDDLLFSWFKASRLEVVRAPDSDLVHVFHRKVCAKSLSAAQTRSCHGVKWHSEAARSVWAQWVDQLRESGRDPRDEMRAVLDGV